MIKNWLYASLFLFPLKQYICSTRITTNMKKTILFLTIILLLSSCAELLTIAEQTVNTATTKPTEQENASGLKNALSVGITNAVLALNKQDGFLKDNMVKILLPKEAAIITDNIKLIPGGEKMVNDFELRLNRSAEDAAIAAKPIFIKAIKDITIADAWSILTAGDHAATDYLQKATYKSLQKAFQPKIKKSLDKKIVAGISTYQSWNTLTSSYNKLANSIIGKTSSLTPVNTELDTYVTQKALDGLFLKVAEEEKKIRENPIARVNDILKRVFGQLDGR